MVRIFYLILIKALVMKIIILAIIKIITTFDIGRLRFISIKLPHGQSILFNTYISLGNENYNSCYYKNNYHFLYC